jgi:hypothetical protein
MSIARTLSRIGIAKNYGGNSRFAEVSKACRFGNHYPFAFHESINGQTFSTKKRAKWRACFNDLTVGTAAKFQPWRALNRRLTLFMTNTRPRRRTTRQFWSRFLSDLSELTTFIALFQRATAKFQVADHMHSFIRCQRQGWPSSGATAPQKNWPRIFIHGQVQGGTGN